MSEDTFWLESLYAFLPNNLYITNIVTINQRIQKLIKSPTWNCMRLLHSYSRWSATNYIYRTVLWFLCLSSGFITFLEGGPSDPSLQWKRASKIQATFKLKFCWKKLFALIVISIVQWRSFEITIEVTIEATLNLLWPVL
jgi:hypothetical protein